MLTSRNIYVGLMFMAGIIWGAAVVARPSLASGPVPPIMVLLLVSLAIDLAAMALAAKRGSEPVTMNARLIGFFGACGLYLLFTLSAGISPAG